MIVEASIEWRLQGVAEVTGPMVEIVLPVETTFPGTDFALPFYEC